MSLVIDLTGLPRENQQAAYRDVSALGAISVWVLFGAPASPPPEIAWSAPDHPGSWWPT